MDILMLAPQPVYSPRGTPISVINRCRALTALGHQVDLVTYPIGDDVAMPGLRFVRTPRLPGLRQVKIGPSLAKLPLDVLLFAVAAGRLCRHRYDVIHTHEEAGAAGWLLHAAFRLPHVHDVHDDLVGVLRDYGFGQRHPLVLLARWLEHRVFTSADALIATFPQLLPTLTVQAPRTPVHVIYNSPIGHQVDPALSSKLRSRWGRDRLVVLYAGSLEPYQGIPLLLEAMPVVRRVLPAAQLVLVGGRQAQAAEVTRQAAALGIAEAVRCEGLRPPDEIPSYLDAADVLVSTRRNGINTPLKVFAYLRAGKPIVATRTASHVQILDDRCAVLAETAPEAIAAALLAVLRDQDLSARLSQAATERAQDFGAGPYLRETAAAYQDLGAPAPSEQALQKIVATFGEMS